MNLHTDKPTDEDSTPYTEKGMRDLREKDLSILIDPPPNETDRLLELPVVADQYRNRKNPAKMQDLLDKDMESLFNAILMDAGLPSSMYMITGIAKSTVSDIKFHKDYFGASRPKELAQKHGIYFECDHLDSAQTASYPSGHTTQACYVAMVLGEIYPEIKSKLDSLADKIANSRIDRGVHLPSDNEAGRKLAEALFQKTRKNVLEGETRYREVFGG